MNLYQVYTEDGGIFYPTKAEALAAFELAGGDAELTYERVGTDRRTLCDIINGTGGYVYGSKVIKVKKFSVTVGGLV
jgi:hypothetical protein